MGRCAARETRERRTIKICGALFHDLQLASLEIKEDAKCPALTRNTQVSFFMHHRELPTMVKYSTLERSFLKDDKLAVAYREWRHSSLNQIFPLEYDTGLLNSRLKYITHATNGFLVPSLDFCSCSSRRLSENRAIIKSIIKEIMPEHFSKALYKTL